MRIEAVAVAVVATAVTLAGPTAGPSLGGNHRLPAGNRRRRCPVFRPDGTGPSHPRPSPRPDGVGGIRR